MDTSFEMNEILLLNDVDGLGPRSNPSWAAQMDDEDRAEQEVVEMDTSEIVPIAALEESSSYGNSVGIVLTELPKRPAGIVPQEVSSVGNAALEELSS
ncbi:hypothetical protein DPMN_065349 [Dreissena polymorpha]|uniref:Uncharacterized protein n=1 Tax=Dreissena polymorpha TaxID=45954 RepID=A0A9D4HN21_DREPO|nr:hypothetical protein DPMN_065349 [Dreissena polymorpha]